MAEDETYWAAREKGEMVDAVEAHVHDYFEELIHTGAYEVMKRTYWRYYNQESGDSGGGGEGGQHAGSLISYGGEQGELSYVRVNHFRSFVRHLLSLTTSNRPSFEPRPRTGDEKARQQVPAARNLLEWEFRRGRLEVVTTRAVEIALVMREGYVWIDWDFRAGEKLRDEMEYDADGQPVYEDVDDAEDGGGPLYQRVREVYAGDLVGRELTPLDVITPNCLDPRDPPWRVVRSTANRWDLAASYPELAEKIRAHNTTPDDMRFDRTMTGRESTDEVPVWYFYHKRSAAMPEGRHVIYLDSEIVLSDGPLPFPSIPVRRIAPAEQIGAGVGYADSWDLVGLAEAFDAGFSALLTTVDAFAHPILVASEGSDMQPEDVAGGMSLFKHPAGQERPAWMMPPPPSPAPRELMTASEDAMAKLSGINNTVRGDPDSNIKSGAMASLIQSEAMRYNAGLQGDYFRLLEEVGTLVIQVYQQFADESRLISIIGDDSDALDAFRKDDIADIDGVTLDVGNPLARTTAGRYQLAEKLLDAKMIDPGQFMEVMRTGAVDDFFKRPRAERTLIRQENELLSKGPGLIDPAPIIDHRTGEAKPPEHEKTVDGVPVLAIDKHPQHMQEHAVVLSRAKARNDAAVVAAVMGHIYNHYGAWKGMAPELRKVLGIPDAPPTLEEAMQQGAPQQRPPQQPQQGPPGGEGFAGSPPRGPAGPPTQAGPQGPSPAAPPMAPNGPPQA